MFVSMPTLTINSLAEWIMENGFFTVKGGTIYLQDGAKMTLDVGSDIGLEK